MTRAEAESLLAECRRKIDNIDSQLRDLLNQRAAIVDDVVRAKEALRIPIHEPKREEEVIHRATNGNPGPLGDDAFRAIFEAIMREMRHIQQVYLERQQEKPK
ncbi:MAG: chorismate mutase [Bryobacterales bacterium]|nr:chorismate mutase [Bryobacterales bacterium]